jgi:hypothetical protein
MADTSLDILQSCSLAGVASIQPICNLLPPARYGRLPYTFCSLAVLQELHQASLPVICCRLQDMAETPLDILQSCSLAGVASSQMEGSAIPCYHIGLCIVCVNSGWMSVDRSQYTTFQTYKTRIRECRMQATHHNNNAFFTLPYMQHSVRHIVLFMLITCTFVQYVLICISVCTNWILI